MIILTAKAQSAPQLLAFFFGCLLLGLATRVQAQETPGLRYTGTRDNSDVAVIGERTGTSDYAGLQIRLSGQDYLISPAANGKPFHILNFSNDWVEIRLQTAQDNSPELVRRIGYRFFRSEESLYRALLLNQVDLGVFSDERLADDAAKNNPDLILLPRQRPANTLELIVYNLGHPILKNREVRQAISLAIPLNRIIQKTLVNKAERARGGVYEPGNPMFPRGVEDYSYSRKRAIQTLEQAGWIDTDGDGIREKRGRKLQIQLAYREGVVVDEKLAREVLLACIPIGIEISPVKLSLRDLKAHLHSSDFQAALWEQHFKEDIRDLYRFFSDPGTSFIRFGKPAWDGYYQNALNSTDSSQIRLLAQAMQRVLSDECAASFLIFRWYEFVVVNTAKLDILDRETGGLRPMENWQFTNPRRLR